MVCEIKTEMSLFLTLNERTNHYCFNEVFTIVCAEAIRDWLGDTPPHILLYADENHTGTGYPWAELCIKPTPLGSMENPYYVQLPRAIASKFVSVEKEGENFFRIPYALGKLLTTRTRIKDGSRFHWEIEVPV